MKKLYKNDEKCCIEMSLKELEVLNAILSFPNVVYEDHDGIAKCYESVNKIYNDKPDDSTFCGCPKCGQNFKFNELMVFHPSCGYLDKEKQ